MGYVQVFSDLVLPPYDLPLLAWHIRYAVVFGVICLYAKSLGLKGFAIPAAVVLSTLAPFAPSWLKRVTACVPEPYLDEVFHIPQAQLYCEGRYYEWDDKITTPPGLYIFTVLYNRLMRYGCSVYDLRIVNVDVILLLAGVSLLSRTYLESGQGFSYRAIGTAINVALFPLLAFFSGLYYTDPLSTLAVLLAYTTHLAFEAKGKLSILRGVCTVACGLSSLTLRQTNIFWVVGYLGGLEIISAIKRLEPKPVKTPTFRTLEEQLRFYAWRYSLGDIHDPPVSLTYPVDIALCVISMAIAATCNITTVVRAFLPHSIVAAAFVAFVIWNGGVVLGDKSNHVATLHLAQMLYIWPLFAFFSAPLFIPRVLDLIKAAYWTITSSPLQTENKIAKGKTDSKGYKSTQTDALQIFNQIGSNHLLHRALVILAALAMATLIVHFNTIIHPFTLADNRHYMFYVFRYSILKVWWIRYALVPIYVGCSWLCWAALQGSGGNAATGSDLKWVQSPFSPQEASKRQEASKGLTPTTEDLGSAANHSPPTSTVLLLLLTSTLSLMTAPLVEPRYFILPWVLWRLLVPAYSPQPRTENTSVFFPILLTGSFVIIAAPALEGFYFQLAYLGLSIGFRSGSASPRTVKSSIDYPLLLETLWFALINGVTMLVFLYMPFQWRSPDGELLDGGRMQRFMW
ncbi:glycosyltransferase family 59 protein [Xylariaceae sp. FL0255]|nr:glycosyltransferase family 59 protein [Xylariaceae sp. FL0255]